MLLLLVIVVVLSAAANWMVASLLWLGSGTLRQEKRPIDMNVSVGFNRREVSPIQIQFQIMARRLERASVWVRSSVTNFKFETKEFTSFSLFILKFETTCDGFPQLCPPSFGFPDMSVVRVPVAGSWVFFWLLVARGSLPTAQRLETASKRGTPAGMWAT